MRLIFVLLILLLAGCSSTPTSAPAPTATWTATAAPVATNTPSPTDLPSPTPTSSPAPSWTPTGTPEPTATATAEPTATATSAPTVPPTGSAAALDLATWEMPFVAAGVTLKVIDEMEATAEGLRSGTLASFEAGGTLMGLQIGLAAVAQALEERPLQGQAARFEDDLQAAMRTVYGIMTRWQDGELSSATVGPELAAAKAEVERLLSDLGAAAGLTPAQLDDLLATLD